MPSVETAPTVGLRDHWYVVCAREALADGPRTLTCCGRTATYMRLADTIACDDAALVLREVDGYLFLWNGDGPPTHEPPALMGVDRPRTVWERGSVTVDAPWTDFVENTLDLVHPMYAHAWTHPSWWLHQLGVRPTFEATVTPTPTGWVAEAHVLLPFGRRWRIVWQELTLPDRVRLVVTPPRLHGERGIAVGATEVVAYHPPETDGRSRMEYAMARRAFPFERARTDWRPGGRTLHRQDQAVLEGLARNRARFPDAREANVPSDAYTLLFRKVLAEAAAGRWAEGWSRFPAPMTLRARI